MSVLPADIQANALFQSHAVLQRGRPIPVFGTGPAGQPVSVEFDGETKSTTVDASGKWLVTFKSRRAGGPYRISLNGAPIAEDVMVGEVWIASGQSNMEFVVASAHDYDAAREMANPAIRMFTVPKTSVGEPAANVQGAWAPAARDTVGMFSAVGFWFADRLYMDLRVPIGVIHTSWGGTPAESWTSIGRLRRMPEMASRVKQYDDAAPDFASKRAAYESQLQAWNAKRVDTGNEGVGRGWSGAGFADTDWRAVTLPATVESILGRDFDGAFWFRRTIQLPDGFSGGATLELGAIDDFDVTYINGVEVGRTGQEVANHWMAPRKYTVPAGVLRPGANTIAIRVFDWAGTGGVTGPDTAMTLRPEGGSAIPLSGEWRFMVERELTLGPAPTEPFGPGNPWYPSSLYNGMIAPLAPYGIRGAIWYQGESNADRAYQYRTLFPAMISDWRQRFGQGDFPFYFVQLANYTARQDNPVESDWAELREAQDMTLKLRNTGMATAIDIGDADDIHPRDKRTVGVRLALIALAKPYGLRVEFTGPRKKSVEFAGDRAVVTFDHADGLRTRDGRAPTGFALAGEDRKYYWATAEIQGQTVVLRSPQVPNPVAVRYLWENNPPANLYNSANLPAVPFRTDSWKGLTQGRE